MPSSDGRVLPVFAGVPDAQDDNDVFQVVAVDDHVGAVRMAPHGRCDLCSQSRRFRIVRQELASRLQTREIRVGLREPESPGTERIDFDQILLSRPAEAVSA